MEITFENYIELKLKKLKRAEIAYALGVPEWKLKRIISANNWGTKLPTLNHSSFDNLSEASAYWAGFLAADGNVDSKNRVRIMLKYDDIGHLVKFANFLESTHKIQSNTTTYDRCAFEFTSKNIVEKLYSLYNIVPNKSLILLPPNSLGSYIVDFIRGYFDGDGSLCESFSNVNSKTATIYATLVSGSIKFTNWMEQFLDMNSIAYSTEHWENKSQIKMNTNQAKLFLHLIYSGSTEDIRLDRKYLKYENIVIKNNRLVR